MAHHTLKTWPNFFEAVWRGDKTFEVRIDDRGYQKGDTVTLCEWDRKDPCDCSGSDHGDRCAKFSGRTVTARVGHVMASTPPRGSQRGFVGNGYVVFSLCDPKQHDGRARADSSGQSRVNVLIDTTGASEAARIMAAANRAAAAAKANLEGRS